jgi:hypothetical protein
MKELDPTDLARIDSERAKCPLHARQTKDLHVSRQHAAARRKFHGSEADLARAATDFLKLDGWRPFKTDPVSNRELGKGFGEKGMADYLYLRYGYLKRKRFGPTDVLAEVMWIEWKTPRGRLATHQHFWRETEVNRGAVALIAGVDFPATLEGFLDWYYASGLQRREIRVR